MFERQPAQDRYQPGQIQQDPRADGGRRVVRVTRNGVLIERRLKGVAMTIGVPFAAYRGVALAVEAGPASGVAAYRLSLAHADPDLDVLLCETKDSGAAAADWKYWSFFLDLPRLAVAGRRGCAAPGRKARRRAPSRRGDREAPPALSCAPQGRRAGARRARCSTASARSSATSEEAARGSRPKGRETAGDPHRGWRERAPAREGSPGPP